MNREEAIYFANCLKNNYTVDLNDMKAFCDMAIKALAQEPATKNDSSELEKNSKKLEKGTTKNDLGVDCVSRQAISGYIDYILSHGMGKKKSFGFIKKFVDKLPSVTPQEPRKGYLSIDDVMSVFDDFMCGEVDEDGTETFLEMLKDKADMREVEE